MAQLQQYIKARFGRDPFSQPNREHQLIQQIEQRDEDAVVELLQQSGARRQVVTANSFGQTALGAAITYLSNRTDIIATILDCGAKVNKRGARGETPLFKAVYARRLDIAMLLLERGADPNKADTVYKLSPLEMAIRRSATDIAHELMNHGASIHTGAILEAIEQNNHAIFDRLMDAGVSPTIRRGTLTTLHLAAMRGSDEMLEKLLAFPQMRALVNDAQNNHLMQPHTALQMLRCKCWIIEAEFSGPETEECCHTRAARLLMDAGADPNLVPGPDQLKYSALKTACSECSLPMVKLLVERGAALVAPSPDYQNVLWFVKQCQKGDAVIRYLVQILFSQESESVITTCGRTAFAYASYRELFDVTNRILEYNSDVEYWLPTNNGPFQDLPLKHCVKGINIRQVVYLLQLGVDPNIGLIKEYKYFRGLSADSQLKHHSRYRFSTAPLNLAVSPHSWDKRARRLSTINCLLYYGANPNIPGVYYTPLHALTENFGSISNDVIPSVKMMVLCGLDMSAEQWLLDRLHPGVPLGSPQLRQWLLHNVKQPMPLFHRCIIVIRTLLAPKTYCKADQLPLPRQLKDYILLRHIFTPPVVDSQGVTVKEASSEVDT